MHRGRNRLKISNFSVKKFSDVPVQKWFILGGAPLLKMSSFGKNGGETKNAVFLYGENSGKYTFVSDDTEVTIRRAE